MKKSLLIALALSLALTLTACGGGEGASSSGSSSTSGDMSSSSSSTASSTPSQGATKQVGDDTLGYLTIPGDWVPFVDVNGVQGLQYSDLIGDCILTLSIFDMESVPADLKPTFTAQTAAESIWMNIEAQGAQQVEGAVVKMGEYEAYQVYGVFPDGTHMITWSFADGAGVLHYVSLEGSVDGIAAVYELVETSYTLTPTPQ